MDVTSELTAERIVNTFEPSEIERIIRSYGEERWARRIAQFIVARRPLRAEAALLPLVKVRVGAGSAA